MSITSKDGFKGNSSTSTKLITPRTINGTNFDGTANITTANWGTTRTLTIGNTGKSVNGAGNVSWSLSEIGAAAINHGNHVPTTQTANSRVFLRNDNTWQSLPTASTSANGIVQLNNTINSTSTTQAATANAVKIAYDLANGKAASNHTHTSLKVADTRNANTAPSALDSVFSVDFKYRSTINNAPGAGTYNGLLQFAPWNDSSGGNVYQMSYGYSGTVPYLGIRTADLNSSSWGSWYEIYHTGRKPSKADVGLSNVQNWTATSDTNDSSRSKYATAAGVKAAYDKANSAYTMASNSPSLYTYECDFSSDTIYNITLPSGFTRSNVIIVGAMMMNSTNTEVDRPLIVGMDIAMAPLAPGTPEDKFSFYYTGGTIREKVIVAIMKVGNLYR